LREAWHDVAYVAEIARNASDIEIVNEAHSQGRLLLTEDKDFGELVFRLAPPRTGSCYYGLSQK